MKPVTAAKATINVEGIGWSGCIVMDDVSDYDVAEFLRSFRPVLEHLTLRGERKRLVRKREENLARLVQLPMPLGEGPIDRSDRAVDVVIEGLDLELLKNTKPPALIVPQLWAAGIRDRALVTLVMKRLEDYIPHLKGTHGLDAEVQKLMNAID